MNPTTYELRPLQGLGPIELGMTRDESRLAMGQTPKTFRKSPLSTTLTDAYQGNALQVFFDEEERVEFIELSRNDETVAVFQGTDLLHTPAEQVVLLLCSVADLDSSHPELGNTYTFPELELSLWRAEVPQGVGDSAGRFFNAVGIGKLGYFSR